MGVGHHINPGERRARSVSEMPSSVRWVAKGNPSFDVCEGMAPMSLSRGNPMAGRLWPPYGTSKDSREEALHAGVVCPH